MRKEQVKDYHYGFYEAAEFPKPVLNNSFPRFRIGVTGGWARIIARTSEQVPSYLKQYVKELKSGFHLGADLAYFFPSDYGIGMRYGLFKNSNEGLDLFARRSGDITVNFIGPSVYQRVILPEQTIAFVSSVSLGVLTYSQTWTSSPADLSGTSAGLNISLGYDFMLKPHLALCLEASATLGSFGKFKQKSKGTKNTIELEERENVSRIDLGIGLRFCK